MSARGTAAKPRNRFNVKQFARPATQLDYARAINGLWVGRRARPSLPRSASRIRFHRVARAPRGHAIRSSAALDGASPRHGCSPSAGLSAAWTMFSKSRALTLSAARVSESSPEKFNPFLSPSLLPSRGRRLMARERLRRSHAIHRIADLLSRILALRHAETHGVINLNTNKNEQYVSFQVKY